MENNLVLRVNIPEDISIYLQRLQYEYQSRKDIIALLLETHQNDVSVITSPTFIKYQELTGESVAAYDIAKAELEQMYVPKELNGHQINWNLDFNTSILTIEPVCECGKEIVRNIIAAQVNE